MNNFAKSILSVHMSKTGDRFVSIEVQNGRTKIKGYQSQIEKQFDFEMLPSPRAVAKKQNDGEILLLFA